MTELLTEVHDLNKKRFHKEANEHYTYPSASQLINNLDHLSDMIDHHKKIQRPRLQTLENYYKGDNETILSGKRRKEEHQADNRAVHNFAEYVSTFIQGYMVGIPLKTTYEDKEMDKKIADMNRANDADEHNSEMVLNQSIYGRAYELLYRGQDDVSRFEEVSPLNTFVIYDDTVARKPIAGVRYIKNKYTEDEIVHLYLADQIVKYRIADDSNLEKIEPEDDKESLNPFSGVPIIEYENNKFRLGDFEVALSLIDLYDGAESDLANYSQDLNDAILAIFGDFDFEGYEEKDPIKILKKMKDANLLHFVPPIGADGKEGRMDAKYLYKQYDVAGSEAYKTRIANDIHLFTATPNMNDSQFSGTQSGESMKYKLFLLEQKRAAKERRFKKSLRERYRLISNVMERLSEGKLDINDLKIVFTENLPKNIAQEMKWFADAGGRLSQRTMREQLTFIENQQEEEERLEEEANQKGINQPVYDADFRALQQQQEELRKQQEEVIESV